MMDDIAAQRFTQLSRDRWQYDVVSKAGRKYQVVYAILPYGYVQEVLNEVVTADSISKPTLIWNREFKAGENLAKTWVQHVRGV